MNTNLMGIPKVALVLSVVLSTSTGSFTVFAGEDAPASDDLTELLNEVIRKRGVVALAGAAVRDGQLVESGVAGKRATGSDVSVEINDPFHLGSCTKTVTATLIGLLIDQQKLTWNTTLSAALPEIAQQMHADFRNVTVEQLLRHESGLPHTNPAGMSLRQMHDLPGTEQEARRDYVVRLLSAPPRFPPGTKATYSNAGYTVAGHIAESVTKTSFESLVREQIFRKLQMQSAGFGAMGTPGKVDAPRQHVSYFGFQRPVEPGPRADNPRVITPAGRLHCSIRDWASFVAVHTSMESKFLKPDTRLRMQNVSAHGYGIGWVPTSAQNRRLYGNIVFQNGSNTMNYAIAWLAIDHNVAVMAMTNQAGTAAQGACNDVCLHLLQKYVTRK